MPSKRNLPTSRGATATPAWALQYDARQFPRMGVAADLVALAIALDGTTEADVPSRLQVLVIERGTDTVFPGEEALPGGFVDAEDDCDAEAAARREGAEETQLPTDALQLDELRTYSAKGRDPREFAGHSGPDGQWVSTGARVSSQAFLTLLDSPTAVRGPQSGHSRTTDSSRAGWRDVSAVLPYEDVRTAAGRERARHLQRVVRQALRGTTWSPAETPVPPDLAALGAALFDLDRWNEEYASHRYRLLLALGLVAEAWRDHWGQQCLDRTPGNAAHLSHLTGPILAFDHRLMLADALTRVRGKVKYHVGTLRRLLPAQFPLGEAHLRLEALLGRPLHESNLRRVLLATSALRPSGTMHESPRGGPRPKLYRVDPGVSAEWRLATALTIPYLPLDDAS